MWCETHNDRIYGGDTLPYCNFGLCQGAEWRQCVAVPKLLIPEDAPSIEVAGDGKAYPDLWGKPAGRYVLIEEAPDG